MSSPETLAPHPAMGQHAGQSSMFREAGEIAAVTERQQQRNGALVQQIVASLRRRAPRFIVTCARGSSDHAATYAKYLFETRTGLPVCSFAPSVASIYAARTDLREAVFIAISQSGRSPDLLSAMQAAQHCKACTVAVVNDESSPLAELAQYVLPISAGPEYSVAATKSCVGAMSALYHLGAQWCGKKPMQEALARLPATLAQAWTTDWSEGFAPLAETRQALTLSRGISLAGAQEAALKLKETCMIQAEGISTAEVRHGPMTIVDQGFPVITIATSDASRSDIRRVAQDFVGYGAQVLMAGEPVAGATCLPMPQTPDPNLQPLVFLQAFYKFTNALAFVRGLDPDRPRNLSKVTKTV